MNDSIADFITQLKNAVAVEKETVTLPVSKIKLAIAEVLKQEGFIDSFEAKDKSLTVKLAYDADGQPKITGAARVSRLSKRVYVGFSEIKPVKNGYGKMILTTPKGIMTGDTARKEKIGGEVLFKIW